MIPDPQFLLVGADRRCRKTRSNLTVKRGSNVAIASTPAEIRKNTTALGGTKAVAPTNVICRIIEVANILLQARDRPNWTRSGLNSPAILLAL